MNSYWKAYFRFALPSVCILEILGYVQRTATMQESGYPWLQRIVVGIAMSFVIPPIYIAAVKLWSGRGNHYP